jgi:hypothetical protein
MSLFIDGRLGGIRELSEADSSVLGVAKTEGIDPTTKLDLGRKEIGLDLEQFLNTYYAGAGYSLGQVVVTEALKQWHVYLSLALIYRDAYYSQLNDRYSARFKEFENRARRASEQCYAVGIGVVWVPIPQAPAPQITPSAVRSTAGMWQARISWLGEGGEEGDWSEPVTVQVPEGSTFAVAAPSAPAGVTGWNLYAGLLEEQSRRQNDAPLDLASSWTMTQATGGDGPTGGGGQQPQKHLQKARILRRG